MATSLHLTRCVIPLQNGERWWGGAIQDGATMPFGPKPYARDLRSDHGGNQAVPLLLSNRGRYLWSADAFAFSFEEGRLILDGGAARIEEGFGDLAGAYRAASRKHFPASGKMPDPIAITAPQFNTWMEMGYEPTQEGVLAYAEAIVAHGIRPGLLVLDDGWNEDYGNWNFHPGRFPDPDTMMAKLRDMGFAVMLWIVPFVSPDGPVARELARKGLLLREARGEIAIRQWWNGHSAVLDVTHPLAVDWLCGQLDSLVERFGVVGFKMDAGDPDAFRTEDLAFAPTDPTGYCEAWGRFGLRYGLTEYRACWKLGGRSAIHRLRDKHHRWGRDGLADLIPNALAQGLAGHAFICPDMVGGGDIGTSQHAEVDAELFVRTAQCSILFPTVQFSIAPWRVLDEKHLGYCSQAIALRERFVPTLLCLAKEAARTGEPIMRHFEYSYPGSGYEDVNDQFLVGDTIMVAPILERGARSRSVVFPEGKWCSEDGVKFVGPSQALIEGPISRLPWFERET